MPEAVTLPLIWVLNGFLLVVYVLLARWTAVILIAPLVWLCISTESSRRTWMIVASGLALLCTLLAPTMMGVWLILMAWGSLIALRLEKFNPAMLRWRIAGGLAAYALVGLGFLLYQLLTPVLADPSGFFAQGQGYLNVIIGIAVYVLPLGFIGMLVQAIWVHPPIEGRTPEDMLYQVRTRGHERK